MELLCAQKVVRSLWHGLLELSDTCWQEKFQDYDHYRILMHAEQQQQYQHLDSRKDCHEGPSIQAVSASKVTVHQGLNCLHQ
jgi:hypothetical protein